MSINTRLWIIEHPRLIYLVVIPAMLGGFIFGHAIAGSWGAVIGGGISVEIALFGYAYFRGHLIRGMAPSDLPSEPPLEPPTEDAPQPAPLLPYSPLILGAHAELPDDRDA
jgi:hypothetical protein